MRHDIQLKEIKNYVKDNFKDLCQMPKSLKRQEKNVWMNQIFRDKFKQRNPGYLESKDALIKQVKMMSVENQDQFVEEVRGIQYSNF